MDCKPPHSPVHGILQGKKTLECVVTEAVKSQWEGKTGDGHIESYRRCLTVSPLLRLVQFSTKRIPAATTSQFWGPVAHLTTAGVDSG